MRALIEEKGWEFLRLQIVSLIILLYWRQVISAVTHITLSTDVMLQQREMLVPNMDTGFLASVTRSWLLAMKATPIVTDMPPTPYLLKQRCLGKPALLRLISYWLPYTRWSRKAWQSTSEDNRPSQIFTDIDNILQPTSQDCHQKFISGEVSCLPFYHSVFHSFPFYPPPPASKWPLSHQTRSLGRKCLVNVLRAHGTCLVAANVVLFLSTITDANAVASESTVCYRVVSC